MSTSTDWQYEVLRWTKINPKPVTENMNDYMARCVEHFAGVQKEKFVSDIDGSQDIYDLKAQYE